MLLIIILSSLSLSRLPRLQKYDFFLNPQKKFATEMFFLSYSKVYFTNRQLNMMSLQYFFCYISVSFKLLFVLGFISCFQKGLHIVS